MSKVAAPTVPPQSTTTVNTPDKTQDGNPHSALLFECQYMDMRGGGNVIVFI